MAPLRVADGVRAPTSATLVEVVPDDAVTLMVTIVAVGSSPDLPSLARGQGRLGAGRLRTVRVMPATTRPSRSRRTEHDVVVVGCCAAGAATAMLLARRGLRVALVERHDSWSHPAPVHPLMRAAVVQLSRWGLLAEVAPGAAPIRRTTSSHADEHATVTIKPAHGIDALYALAGDPLDCALLRAAGDAGAEVHRRPAIVHTVSNGDGIVGVDVTGPGGATLELRAPLTVGADGTDSVIARAAGAPFTTVGTVPWPTTYACWPGLEVDGYEWILRPHARLAVVPVATGGALVFASAPATVIGSGGPAVIAGLAAEAEPALARRLGRRADAEPGGTWTGQPAFIRRSSGPGWALVGDAGCHVDPIGPYGFTAPLRDAELLAAHVARATEGGSSIDDAVTAYEACRDVLALAVFDVVDQLTNPATAGSGVADLLARLSSTMTDEIEALNEINWEEAS
jgi:2-polyprenyl-6-methoxyphenol hydroxylase-like FAD-dependent oxidoreductase